MAKDMPDAWAAVMALARTARPDGSAANAIRPLFDTDAGRFARFSWSADGLLLDLSKTALTDAVLAALLDLARTARLGARRDAMAAGEPVNVTEGRAVMHLALRAPADAGFRVGTEDASAEVHDTLARMREFAGAVGAGTLCGATGERFTDVLNIGIGGSDLGPAMVARALHTPASPLRAHYLGNVDAHAWEEIRQRLDPRRTLVLVASKTFTTQETMTNAALVRGWLAEALGEAGVGRHLAALSTNLPATAAFGIAPERVFPFRDWVGGRFSLWSAIGLSLAISLGWDSFARLLAGARAMDEHFLTAPLEANLPVLLALAEVWHVNGLGLGARAVLPYDERLARLPAHLQQVEMESLGKRVTLGGAAVARATGPVVFGEPGTNAQHTSCSCCTRAPPRCRRTSSWSRGPTTRMPTATASCWPTCLAQAEALMRGKTAEEVRAEMAGAGPDAAEVDRLAPHRAFPGNRPSTTILLPHPDAGHARARWWRCTRTRCSASARSGTSTPSTSGGSSWASSLPGRSCRRWKAGRRRTGTDGSTIGLLRAIGRLQG